MEQFQDLNNNFFKSHNNTSINLNKYKILSNFSNSKISNLSPSISNININKNLNINQDNEIQTINSMQGLRRFKINIQSNNNSAIEDLGNISSNELIQINNKTNNNSIHGTKIENNIKLNTITIPNYTYFDKKAKNEKESRRMLIEYIKLLRKKNEKIEDFLNNNRISTLILQQDKEIIKIQNPITQTSLFTSLNNSPIGITPEYTSVQNSTPNLFENIISDSKEKINYLNFLSVPRIMNIITNNDRKPYVFYMTPNEISYIKGVEDYIFKWIDIKNLNINNNCNLILLNSCFVDKLNNERFYIIYHEDDLQNENGSLDFTLLIEASSKELCDNYVTCLNYFSKYCKEKNKNLKDAF